MIRVMVDLSKFKTARVVMAISNDGIIASHTAKVNPGINRLEQIKSEYKSKSDYIPVIGDKLYFLPGCEIPRVKVRDHCKVSSTSIVRQNYKDATAVFIGAKTINEFFRIEWYTKVGKESYIQWLDLASKDLEEDLKVEFNQEIKQIKDTDSDFVCLSYGPASMYAGRSYCYWLSGTDNSKKLVCLFPEDEKKKRQMELKNSLTCVIRTDMDEGKIQLLNSPVLYDQTSLLKYLNSVPIDTDMYTELDVMLKSSDADNMTLAMEIMSNCVYEKSIVYLLCLLKNNWENMRYTRMIHHVNFKSMITYLRENENNWKWLAYHSAREILFRKGVDTQENRDLMASLDPELVNKSAQLETEV